MRSTALPPALSPLKRRSSPATGRSSVFMSPSAAETQPPPVSLPESPAVRKLSLTATRRDSDREEDKRPLDLHLILRLLTYTRPYAAKRNWLLLCVGLRAFQLPAIAWTIGAV